MNSHGKTIAIIPARGGSKAILRKNLTVLGDKPLLAWPIELAKSIVEIDKIVVSSDDDEIIRVANKFGAETPFKRPAYLSLDNVPTLPVLQHAVTFLLENEEYPVENVILLYPTTPFLKRERVLSGIELLRSGYSSVVGVRIVRGLLWKKDDEQKRYQRFYPRERINRQLFSHLYEEAGNIYLTKTKVLLEQNKLIDEKNCSFIEIEPEEILDIDSQKDLEIARKSIERFK